MKIALGADHRGTAAISALADRLKSEGHEITMAEECPGQVCDYPERAYAVARTVAGGKADGGILVCGTGIGMSIAANKIKGVRAAVVHDELTAQLCKSHNDANIICMSADLLGQRLMEKICEVWLSTKFEGGRHLRRVHKIEAIEQGKDPSTVTE